MTTDTVLGPQQILHLWDTRVNEPSDKYPLLDSDKLHFARAIEQAVLQSPEMQSLRKDAENFRWLEKHGLVSFPKVRDWMTIRIVHPMPECLTSLRAAIDAAMEKQP